MGVFDLWCSFPLANWSSFYIRRVSSCSLEWFLFLANTRSGLIVYVVVPLVVLVVVHVATTTTWRSPEKTNNMEHILELKNEFETLSHSVSVLGNFFSILESFGSGSFSCFKVRFFLRKYLETFHSSRFLSRCWAEKQRRTNKTNRPFHVQKGREKRELRGGVYGLGLWPIYDWPSERLPLKWNAERDNKNAGQGKMKMFSWICLKCVAISIFNEHLIKRFINGSQGCLRTKQLVLCVIVIDIVIVWCNQH